MNRHGIHRGISNRTRCKFRNCNFELIKNEKNKRVALCLSCHKTFVNTAYKRCEAHSKICKSSKFPQEHQFLIQTENQIFSDVSTSNGQQELLLSSEFLNGSDKISENDSIAEIELKSLPLMRSSSGSHSRSDIMCNDEPITKKIKLRDSLPSLIAIKSGNENIYLKTSNQLILKNSMSSNDDGISDENEILSQNDHNDCLIDLDSLLANFFYSCRVPLKVADSRAFKDFVKTLNPNFICPSSLDLSTRLLDKIYNESHEKQITYLKDEMVLLINAQKDSFCINVTTILSGNSGRKIFLDATEYSSSVKKLNLIELSCQLTEQSFNTKIYATVSNMLPEDNEELFQENSGTKCCVEIWNINCNIEGCNHLIKRIIDNNLAKQCIDMLRDLKQANIESLGLERGIENLNIPSMNELSQNYYLYQDIFKNIIDHLDILRENISNMKMKEDYCFAKSANIELIFNNEFIDRIDKEITKLNSVYELIKDCQLSNFKIADATESWLNLKVPAEYQKTLDKIKNKVLNKYNFAANILHSTYRGRNLTSEERDIGEMFLFEVLDAKGLEDYEQYNSKSSNVFQALSQKDQLSTLTFWGLASRKHASLANLAKKLLDIPASSVKFDHKSEINNIKRSKLDNSELSHEKLRKLIFIQYYLDQISSHEFIQ